MDNPKFMQLNDMINLFSTSIKNKEKLKNTTTCGCFYCKKIFNPSEIKDWTDNGKTAICPYCGIDSIVIHTNKYIITPEVLEILNKQYFTS